MIVSITKRYFVFGTFVLLFFLLFLSSEFQLIYWVNCIGFYTYYYVLHTAFRKPQSYYNRDTLKILVFFYLLIFVTLYNCVSFFYNGNFYVFSESDAVNYSNEASAMALKPIVESIVYYLNYFELEDLGIVFIISTLYRIVESNLMLNAFYIFIGVSTALSIFRLSKNFISIKYSFLCSLAYSISSFVIWFHSSGLKESFLVMLIVFFYDYYFLFAKYKKLKWLICSITCLFLILFFRPVIIIFCIASVGFTMLFSKGKPGRKIALLLTFIILVFSISSFLTSILSRFIGGGGVEQMLAAQAAEGMIVNSIQFTYQVNILATAIGPLPTVLPNVKPLLAFFSTGLIYRVLIATAFWMGVYYSIKSKSVQLYSLLFFIFMEMVSLVFILEALELRKSLPHFPFIYIIAFWFLDNFDRKEFLSPNVKSRIKFIWNLSSVLFLVIIFYWNFRVKT